MDVVTGLRTGEYSKAELAAMTPTEFVDLLRNECMTGRRGMDNHPFVTGMEAGTVTVPQIHLWIEQFYLHIRNMLPWIGQIYVTCPHEDVRAILAKNLAEEVLGTFTRTKGHPDLLLEFGRAMGMDTEPTRHAEQMKVGRRVTEFFEFMSNCRPWFVPLAAIGIGLETFVPPNFSRIIEAAKKNYGMADKDLVFFSMHVVADQEHGDEGIELVSKYATTPEARKFVYDCTVETSERFFDLWNVYTVANG
jgi:pyrroloquinoline-quinone synthase